MFPRGVARGQFSLIRTHRPCLECTHTLTLYMYCSYILHTYEHVVQTFHPSSPRKIFCFGLSLSLARSIANIHTHMMIHTNAIIHIYIRTQMRTHIHTGMHIVEYIGTHTHTYMYTYSVLEPHQGQKIKLTLTDSLADEESTLVYSAACCPDCFSALCCGLSQSPCCATRSCRVSKRQLQMQSAVFRGRR